MNNIQLALTIWLQRIIELLAFYLILANIDGKHLKTSFVRLVKTKQRPFLYGNVIVIILYPILITTTILLLPQYGYIIDSFFYPFIAFFLLRRVFSLKKTLIVYLFLLIITGIGELANSLFSLGYIPAFLLILGIVILNAYYFNFEKFYHYLLKKHLLLKIYLMISIIMYIASFYVFFFFGYFTLEVTIAVAITLLILIFTAYIYTRQATYMILKQIKKATKDDLLELLKELSVNHEEEVGIAHCFVIFELPFVSIRDELLMSLKEHHMKYSLSFGYQQSQLRKFKIKIIL